MADDATREDLVYQVKLEQQKPARAARVHRESPEGDPKGSEPGRALPGGKTSSNAAGVDATVGDPTAEAPRKRRRRRRKPAGGLDGGSGSSATGV